MQSSVEIAGAYDVVAGPAHLCIAKNTGISCSGRNDHGQLGDGTNSDGTFVNVLGITSTPLQMVSGENHVCAIMYDGVVKCWGENTHGQLGDGTFSDSSAPVNVVNLGAGSGVLALAAGAQHTCALIRGGHVQCWGDNSRGQLGSGINMMITHSATPIDAQFVSETSGFNGASGNAVSLTAGAEFTCAIFHFPNLSTSSRYQMSCWGDNAYDQLANGSNGIASLSYGVKIIAPSSTYQNVRSVMAGKHFACAIHADHSLLCWGDNSMGQAGQDPSTGLLGVPSYVYDINPGKPAQMASLGDNHACSLEYGGAIRCWGANDHLQRVKQDPGGMNYHPLRMVSW
jgi:alpha-tubulin suppressor-like RCC1 family protein